LNDPLPACDAEDESESTDENGKAFLPFGKRVE
jgi:hypothetical protein